MAKAVPLADSASARRRSLALVFCCTVLGAMAQVLMKSGATTVQRPGLAAVVIGIVTNIRLFAGYALYGLSTVLLVVALREGELSLLYPVIALTYVWVTVLSFVLFHETINPFKMAGIIIIVAGVTVLGRSNPK
jgi:multidrug transporter EmrE-like cation transporter